MRPVAMFAAACALGAVVTPAASARTACPTIVDAAGDTGLIFDVPLPDDRADLTAVAVSSSKTALTARLTVVGTPVANDPARSYLYEVYFDTGEGSYILRASFGNSETRYDLVTDTPTAQAAPGAQGWRVIKSIHGQTAGHTVTITAQLDKDLPVAGRRLPVFGRTWMSFANEVAVGGTRTPQGASATLDETDSKVFRVGDPGCR